ncbi:hypothetical protein Hanom_Chr14g01259541 [Helianthus anomalus]
MFLPPLKNKFALLLPAKYFDFAPGSKLRFCPLSIYSFAFSFSLKNTILPSAKNYVFTPP